MPIDTQHPLYKANIALWTRCRDAYDGEDAVKERGETYLPKIDRAQSGAEYNSYRTRALYYEAVGRTVDGFVGAVARKPHTFALPGAVQVFEDDATTSGMGLAEYVKQLCMETLLIGRAGVLVDYDDATARAYLATYQAEAIFNWGDGSVVLSETVYEANAADPFDVRAVPQIRHLGLLEGRYTVTLWRKPDSPSAREWTIYQQMVPTSKGRPLAEIPFYWLSVMGQTSVIAKPPLLGLVNVAMSHYRTSADLEHGRHWTALPTLYVTGASSEEPIAVGSGAAITLPDPSSKVGYAEFTGQGLGSLERALETKEHQMSQLGAAVLAGVRKGVEAAETARIRVAGESSLLGSVVSAVQETLESAVTMAAQWMGVGGPVTIELNRDFVDQPIDPQTLAGLLASFQAGTISLEAFLYNLAQAEMLPPETDIAEEAKTLSAAIATKQAAEQAAADKVSARAAAAN